MRIRHALLLLFIVSGISHMTFAQNVTVDLNVAGSSDSTNIPDDYSVFESEKNDLAFKFANTLDENEHLFWLKPQLSFGFNIHKTTQTTGGVGFSGGINLPNKGRIGLGYNWFSISEDTPHYYDDDYVSNNIFTFDYYRRYLSVDLPNDIVMVLYPGIGLGFHQSSYRGPDKTALCINPSVSALFGLSSYSGVEASLDIFISNHFTMLLSIGYTF